MHGGIFSDLLWKEGGEKNLSQESHTFRCRPDRNDCRAFDLRDRRLCPVGHADRDDNDRGGTGICSESCDADNLSVVDKKTEKTPRIEDIQIANLYSKAKKYDKLVKFYTLCIEWYSKSWNYDEADYYFKILINPYYKNFSLELLILLINSTSNNSQTFDRRKAGYEHKLIARQFIEKGGKLEQVQTEWSNWDDLIKESA